MVSKKKRGKERQDRKVRQGWVGVLTLRISSFKWVGWGRVAHYSDAECGYCHGRTFVPPPDNKLSTFMNKFWRKIYLRTTSGLPWAEYDAFWRAMQPALRVEPDLRLQASSLLLRLGTNLTLASFQATGDFLSCEQSQDREGITTITSRLRAISLFLVALEPQYQDDPNSNDFSALICYSAAPRSSKLMFGNTRDILKYLHKKAKKESCTCLRPFYLMSRAVLPKVGCCMGCARDMDREDLMVCQCGHSFCSRECHKMVWPDHKFDCKEILALRARVKH